MGRVARRGAYRPLPLLLRGGRGALEASSGAIARGAVRRTATTCSDGGGVSRPRRAVKCADG
jgi:hypothetical protein